VNRVIQALREENTREAIIASRHQRALVEFQALLNGRPEVRDAQGNITEVGYPRTSLDDEWTDFEKMADIVGRW